MYRKGKKIPTILGLSVIILGLISLTLFGPKSQNPTVKATPLIIPQEVKITNLTDNGFTVSFITEDKAKTFLSYGKTTSLGQVAFDDRNEEGKPNDYITHHITIKGLIPSTLYYFKIVSGGKIFDNNGTPYTVTTGPLISSLPPEVEPAYGTVLGKDDTPAEGAIIYLSLGEALPLSTLVKPSGNWLISLSLARTPDLKNYFIPAEEEREEIFVQGERETATAISNIKNDSPIPTIVLGKSYDFQRPQSKKPEVLTKENLPPIVLGETTTSSVEISVPAEGAAIIFPKPLFKGRGVPGKDVTVTVESSPQTGKVKVNPDGSWSWTPQRDLSPGEHTVSVITEDGSGHLVTLKKKFSVLKSGSQVLGEATPSGTISPTVRPTASPTAQVTPTVILSPTKVATSSPTATSGALPKPGTSFPTFFLLGMGALFLFFGLTLYTSASQGETLRG